MVRTRGIQFALDVVGGKYVSGKRRKQACERFLDELRRQNDRSFRWRFDPDRAQRPVTFMERFLRPTKGDYDRMALLPWQCFCEENLYGWVDKQTGLRRFREGLIIVGQGNGKSTMVAGNALYGLTKDGERGPEVYCLANSKDQARIIFNECYAQAQASPLLAKHLRFTKTAIWFDQTNGKFEPLASDSKTLDGKNVHMGIFDELQEYRDYKLINVIKGKIKKRKQPLIIYITTLGTVIDGPLMDLYVLGGEILDGADAISRRASDRIFVYIDEIDEDDDPADPGCWPKANPSLGSLLNIEDLKDEWERVRRIPAERSNFINKSLNVFTLVDEMSYLDVETIRKNCKTVDIDKLRGCRCYGGFDLAETSDFTSACLEFPTDDGLVVLEHSWVPRRKVAEDREKLDWENLIRDGYLTAVDQDYVDYTLVLEWFRQMRQVYQIDAIGYDPAKAFMLVQEMQRDGFVLEVVRQGELTLTAPLDHLRERFQDGAVIHNNDPLFNWYLGNVKLTKRGPNATYLPTKQHANRKIDGFMALLDAHTEMLRKNPLYIPPDKELATVIDLKNL